MGDEDGAAVEAGVGVGVVATTVVLELRGPLNVDVKAEAFGVTVVASVEETTVTVVPPALLVVTVADVVTTTVAYWSQ